MAGHEQHYIMPRAEFEKPVKLAIVMSPYYKDIADNMLAGALREIEAAGGTFEVIQVPGALEIPTAIAIADRGCAPIRQIKTRAAARLLRPCILLH